MTPEERTGAVRAVHESPLRIVLAVAGGGILAVSDLLSVPGGSRTVLEALVPYSVRSLHELMGSPIEPHVSDEAAAAMADGCLARARHLAADPAPGAEAGPLAGIACTAALVTTPPRRGADRAHIAAVSGTGTRISRMVDLDGTAQRVGDKNAPQRDAQRPIAQDRVVSEQAVPDSAAQNRVIQDRFVSDALLGLIVEVAADAVGLETAGQ